MGMADEALKVDPWMGRLSSLSRWHRSRPVCWRMWALKTSPATWAAAWGAFAWRLPGVGPGLWAWTSALRTSGRHAPMQKKLTSRTCAFSRRQTSQPPTLPCPRPAEVTVVFLYLLPWAIEHLKPEMEGIISRGCRVVSFQFHPDFQPSRVTLFGALKLYARTDGDGLAAVAEALKVRVAELHDVTLLRARNRPASCFSIADENTPLALGQLESIVEEGSPSSCADLQSENEALRVALSECLQRLEVLEAEREDFISEGVFDLVNSLWLGEAGQAKRERQGYTVETADRTK
ncbi:unnamed protein product [Effrenium voratum]|nr:unnamed protein product [Effrenium voratum]